MTDILLNNNALFYFMEVSCSPISYSYVRVCSDNQSHHRSCIYTAHEVAIVVYHCSSWKVRVRQSYYVSGRL